MNGIDPSIPPSGDGCVECLETGGWWLHLSALCAMRARRLLRHVASCHATAHNHATGHPVIQSFEPGEDWFYDYRTGQFGDGPRLALPHAHPADQPVSGPRGRVPRNWREKLHT